MEVVVNNASVEFSGLLNEDSSPELIVQALQQAIRNTTDGIVYIDFSGVKRANSCGILTWYKALEMTRGEFVYVKVPRWLVEQFNISDFLNENTSVQSIEANFYCPQNDTHESLLLVLGKDIPILENYDSFNLTLKNKDGLDLEMDFEPSEYFYFISSSYEKFKRSTTT
ncbi:MAG: STAS domain-containing protein [Bdellovibrionota bacterium]